MRETYKTDRKWTVGQEVLHDNKTWTVESVHYLSYHPSTGGGGFYTLTREGETINVPLMCEVPLPPMDEIKEYGSVDKWMSAHIPMAND